MTDESAKLPVVLSRDELYCLIWTTPMSRLAAQYGITGTGLAKICARLNVPCPPRGYWAKKAAGKPVVQFRLAEPDAETPLQVTITPAPVAPKPTLAQTEIQKQITDAGAQNSELAVPEQLVRPHKIIGGWLAEHKRKAQEARHQIDPWRREHMQPKAFTDIDHRRHRILDTLFKALERQGFAIKAEQYQPVYLEVLKERIDFQLREKQKQVRRPLTAEEKRGYFTRDKPYIQELQPAGILIFTIKTWLDAGMRREWKDEADKPLESHLPEIVATLSLAGPFLVKQRQERLEAEKRQWEEDQRCYLERQRREQDQKRWQRFVEFAHQCDQAASVRKLLAELGARPQPEGVRFGDHSAAEWQAWARHWLEQFDPLMHDPRDLYMELAGI